MNYREVEFKYRAAVLLDEFVKICEGLDDRLIKTVQPSGFDNFYSSVKNPDCFCRHRIELGKFNQLSFKRKLTDKNNYIRTEHNLNMDVDTKKSQVQAMLSEFGYKYNTSIFKNCFVYAYELYTLVYYVCYNSELKELDRFVEIELNEDYAWGSEEDAWKALVDLEKRFSVPLLISPQARIKRSLFEMFRKENN